MGFLVLLVGIRVSGVRAVRGFPGMRAVAMRFVEPFGAVGTVEFVAFTGNEQPAHQRQHQDLKFHHAPRLADFRPNATPQVKKMTRHQRGANPKARRDNDGPPPKIT